MTPNANRTRVPSQTITTTPYRNPTSIPQAIIDQLREDALASNVILPHLERLRLQGNEGEIQEGEFWIACTSSVRGSVLPPTLDFLLACTTGPAGRFPIFIYSGRAVHAMDMDFLGDRIPSLVRELLNQQTDKKRVYAVFAVQEVSSKFAEWWYRMTNIAPVPQPYFFASHTYCTSSTFCDVNSQVTPPGWLTEIRLAKTEDIQWAANLCQGFATESVSHFSSLNSVYNETLAYPVPSLSLGKARCRARSWTSYWSRTTLGILGHAAPPWP